MTKYRTLSSSIAIPDQIGNNTLDLLSFSSVQELIDAVKNNPPDTLLIYDAAREDELFMPKDKLRQVESGLFNGLPEDLILFYSDERFSANQMLFIVNRAGMLPVDLVSIFAQPHFSIRQMDSLLELIKNHSIDVDDIKFAANPELTEFETLFVTKCILNKVPKDQISYFLEQGFDEFQLKEIELGLSYVDHKPLTFEQIKRYADARYTDTEMRTLRYGIVNGLSEEQLTFMTQGKFSSQQMFLLRQYFVQGLTIEQAQAHADPELASAQFSAVLQAVTENKDKTYVEILSQKHFSDKQLSFVFRALNSSLPEDIVKLIARPEHNSDVMYALIRAAKDGLPEEYIKLFVDNHYSGPQINILLDTNFYHSTINSNHKKLSDLKDLVIPGLTYEQTTTLAKIYYNDKIDKTQFKFIANPQFNAAQMDQAVRGFEAGLDIKKVETYYKPELSWPQMRQGRKGLTHGLTTKQVTSYLKPENTVPQMIEAKENFYHERDLER